MDYVSLKELISVLYKNNEFPLSLGEINYLDQMIPLCFVQKLLFWSDHLDSNRIKFFVFPIFVYLDFLEFQY